jgi:cellobiose-specific phosphotransferase system component IIC
MKLAAFIILMLMYPLFLRLIHISDLRVIPLVAPYALGILSLIVMFSGIYEFTRNKLRDKQEEEQRRMVTNKQPDTPLGISSYRSTYYQRTAAIVAAILLIVIAGVTLPFAQLAVTDSRPWFSSG